jgi:beta-phosphoglucomutase
VLRAIIFDFDGVIVNSEPLILKLTQQMAAQEGWALSEEEYYRDFLALDDRGIVERLFRSHSRPLSRARRDELVQWKARAYWDAIQDGLPPIPGAIEFVRKVGRDFPLAIASGSMRREVEHLLGKLGLRDAFPVLVAAEDTAKSKPDPEPFLKALEWLQRAAFNQCCGHSPLSSSECLAIEDAPGGIVAAHTAGMKCLALAQSRPRRELQDADWVFENFAEVDIEKIQSEFP